MEAGEVNLKVVAAFYNAHPHPNVLEPLSHPEKKRFIALQDDGKVIAAATLQRRALGLDQLGGVLVHPDRRGVGLGHTIVEAARVNALEHDAKALICGVYRREPDVSLYYKTLGFRTAAPYIPGARTIPPFGWAAKGMAKLLRIEAGPDPIRIMMRRP